MGTTWSVKWRAFSGDPDALIRQIQASLDDTEAEFSTWRADSALSRFNAAPERVPFAVSADFLALTRTAAELTRRTDGAYDPAALPLVKLWGFGAAPRRTAIPTEAELAVALARPGWDTLTIGESSLTRHDPAFQLDLTSVTEGLALKKAAAVLDAAGASGFLLEVGGELTARGAWTVAVERPWRLVRLENATLSTSGTYRQKREALPDGGSVSHLIDARTGRPVTHGTVSVSVIHADPVLADGWATALAILGAEAGAPLANALDLAAQFVIERDGAFRIVSTPHWPEAYPATAAVPSGR